MYIYYNQKKTSVYNIPLETSTALLLQLNSIVDGKVERHISFVHPPVNNESSYREHLSEVPLTQLQVGQVCAADLLPLQSSKRQ